MNPKTKLNQKQHKENPKNKLLMNKKFLKKKNNLKF